MPHISTTLVCDQIIFFALHYVPSVITGHYTTAHRHNEEMKTRQVPSECAGTKYQTQRL